MLKRLTVGLFSLTIASLAMATPPDVAVHWRALTSRDVEAAYRLLKDNHPGAAPATGDQRFQHQLQAGVTAARARVAKVQDFAGYKATLAAFAIGMGDEHIWFRPFYPTFTQAWPRLLPVYQAHRWIIGLDERGDATNLVGAALESCDGKNARDLVNSRLGTYKIVQIASEAQLVRRSNALFVDDGNPFLPLLKRCRFEQGGKTIETDLDWQPITMTDLSEKTKQLGLFGAAGYDLQPVGPGWWIGIQGMNSKAEPVLAAVEGKRDEIRTAPFVVIDLRGNSGGDSTYGERLAKLLLGPSYVAAHVADDTEEYTSCPQSWRLSPGNVEFLKKALADYKRQPQNDTTRYWEDQHEKLINKARTGLKFSSSPNCRDIHTKTLPSGDVRQSAMSGKLYLLTDGSCFSSCMLVTEHLRHLGAIHIGQATDEETHYMEVREEMLPSGLGAFSTLQAVEAAAPVQYGPFAPRIVYDGNIADTDRVKQWVLGLAGQ